MSDFFRLAWEQPDDSGAADLEPTEAVDPAAPNDQPEADPEPEVYTREQLRELLPHFDRFAADHQGEEAFRQYGTAYDNARRLISTGGHMTPQEEASYRAAGIDPAEVQIPQQEEPAYEEPGLFGVPWQAPTTWEEVQAYANSDDPNARRLAAMAVMSEPSAPDDIKNAYFSHWAAIDPAGATLYNQQVMQAEFDRRLAERDAAWEERFGAVNGDLVNRNATDLMETAKAQVKGFEQHAPAVLALWNERVQDEPSFADRFLNWPRERQLTELRRLTTIAAAEAKPQRQAAQATAAQSTEAAILAARTETSRTNGAPETDADAERRREREQMKRVGARVF